MIETASLIIPSFIAGVLTFLAPCTLPLVPGYLGFISGASLDELKDPAKAHRARRKIFLNGVLFIIGFSAVFIVVGSLFGLVGSALVGYRLWLTRIGGVFVILFGLYMMRVFKLPFLTFLETDKHLPAAKVLKPGHPISSVAFGSAFALGWTPCVGPVLGSILTLAAATATVGQGAILLSVFSLGLAVPFLLVALGIGSAARYIANISRYLNAVSVVGGAFLVLIGLFIASGQLSVWIGFAYQFLNFINYDKLVNFL